MRIFLLSLCLSLAVGCAFTTSFQANSEGVDADVTFQDYPLKEHVDGSIVVACNGSCDSAPTDDEATVPAPPPECDNLCRVHNFLSDLLN